MDMIGPEWYSDVYPETIEDPMPGNSGSDVCSTPLNILYVYHMDPTNPRVQSGRPFSIYSQMLARGHHVDVLQAVPGKLDKPLLHSLLAKARGRFHGTERSPGVARFFQKAIRDRLAVSPGYDVIFSPSTLPFALPQNTDAVRVACVDTMFEELIGTYPEFANASLSYIRMGREYDRSVMANTDLLVVPSRAAADGAKRYGDHGADVLIAPFGGNLGSVPGDEETDLAIEARLASECLDFLFIGKDWHRKNGRQVMDVARAIRDAGISSTVHAIGTRVEGFNPETDPIRFYGDIDLSRPEGARQLFELSKATPFFFVPSLAEAYGMAFVEAASMGLPLLGSPVGGIRDIVSPRNGRSYTTDADPTAIAREVIAIWQDRQSYRNLAQGARRTFLETHNWPRFWQSVEMAIGGLRSRKAA